LLLGGIDGIGSESSIAFKLFQLLESLSVVVLKSFEFFDLVELLFVDDFIFITIRIINKTFSTSVDVWVHGAVDSTLLASIGLVFHKVTSIINLTLQNVASVSLLFDVESSFEEVSSAINNGLLDLFTLFQVLVFQESSLLVNGLSLLLVL
jgi:hypothetical protein